MVRICLYICYSYHFASLYYAVVSQPSCHLSVRGRDELPLTWAIPAAAQQPLPPQQQHPQEEQLAGQELQQGPQAAPVHPFPTLGNTQPVTEDNDNLYRLQVDPAQWEDIIHHLTTAAALSKYLSYHVLISATCYAIECCNKLFLCFFF